MPYFGFNPHGQDSNYLQYKSTAVKKSTGVDVDSDIPELPGFTSGRQAVFDEFTKVKPEKAIVFKYPEAPGVVVRTPKGVGIQSPVKTQAVEADADDDFGPEFEIFKAVKRLDKQPAQVLGYERHAF